MIQRSISLVYYTDKGRQVTYHELLKTGDALVANRFLLARGFTAVEVTHVLESFRYDQEHYNVWEKKAIKERRVK